MGRHRLGLVFWVEAVASGLATLFGLLTIAWHDWIEGVFGIDPDHGSGSAEWIAVFILLGIGIAVGALARRRWLRAVAA